MSALELCIATAGDSDDVGDGDESCRKSCYRAYGAAVASVKRAFP